MLRFARLRLASLGAVAALAACYDAPLPVAPVAAAAPALSVAPLAASVRAGASLPVLVSRRASEAASLCLVADTSATACPVSGARFDMTASPSAAESRDTATIAVPLSALARFDRAQRFTLLACEADAPCVHAGAVTVLPNFEASCDARAIGVGEAITSLPGLSDCDVAGIGAGSIVYSFAAAEGRTIAVQLRSPAGCGNTIAIVDETGAVLRAQSTCDITTGTTVVIPHAGTWYVAAHGQAWSEVYVIGR